MKNLGNMMKQAQKLQSKMLEMQEELGNRVVTVQVGGGMVEVKANGRQEITSLRIDPEVVNPDDTEMLQDLIMAAFKEAMDKSHRLAADKFAPLTGGLGVSDLF